MLKRRLLILTGLCCLLVGCVNVKPSDSASLTGAGKNARATTVEASKEDDYRILLIDGHYPISNTRGASLVLGNAASITEFEQGLTQLSKTTFPTSQYFLAEGQFITEQEINGWLARVSEKTPDGLNEADATNTRQSDVVAQILEQDYLIYKDSAYSLEGLSLGVALNPVVTTKENDVLKQETLTDDVLLEKGKQAAAKIVEKLRAKEGMGTIPIVIGLFKQEQAGSLSSGAYMTSAVSKEGSTISDWKASKIEKRLFPLDIDKTDDVRAFNDFRENITNFFPNLNGIVGHATYIEDVLTQLNITITTQFYGSTEMLAFSQYLTEAAQSYFKTGMPIKIVVDSVRGTEIVVFRNKGIEKFQSIILN